MGKYLSARDKGRFGPSSLVHMKTCYFSLEVLCAHLNGMCMMVVCMHKKYNHIVSLTESGSRSIYSQVIHCCQQKFNTESFNSSIYHSCDALTC